MMRSKERKILGESATKLLNLYAAIRGNYKREVALGFPRGYGALRNWRTQNKKETNPRGDL
jgi:hypothetical protein